MMRPFSTRLSGLTLLALAASPGVALGAAHAAGPVAITVTDKACQPDTLSVTEGKVAFDIRNASKRALEWEILKGVMVVAERENILPGFVQKLSGTLEPGEYAMTCGLLSNPRGRLVVLAAATKEAYKPNPMDLVGPIAEYKVYVIHEVAASR